jgi:hypothetical protein
MMHIKLLEKQGQTKPKTSRRREITSISAEINELKTKKTINRIKERKGWFFENINKIKKPLVNMTRWRRKKIQILKIRDEKQDIATNTNKIQRLITEHFENLY